MVVRPAPLADGCVGAARRRRQRLAERQAHGRDLLLLLDDDLLRDAPELLVLAVAQLGQRHVDGALVVRDHHRDEVARRRRRSA